MERTAETHPEQHIPEAHFAHLRVRTSESHSPHASPSQVYGSCDSLLCRTPFQKTIINYFLFTNRFRCTKMKKRHLVWCFFFYFVPKGNELPFAQRMGCSHTALRYLRREEQGSFGSTKWNEWQKLTTSSISLNTISTEFQHHLVWCFSFYVVPKGNELTFA